MAAEERYLVTGASGAIGAWVVKHLLDDGLDVIAFGAADDDRRLRLITTPEQLTSLTRVDATALDLERLQVAMSRVDYVVHTDTVSDEACQNEPAASESTAVGTLSNVMLAAAAAQISGLAFESSMSVYAPTDIAINEKAEVAPASLRGSYHLAKEVEAERSFRDSGVSSIGLRVGLVYGPGQDVGWQGAATRAIAAAVDDRPCHLQHRGMADFQFVSDVAHTLLAAARTSAGRHQVINLSGQQVTMASFVQTVAALTGATGLTVGELDYPIPVALPSDGGAEDLRCPLATPLEVGVRATLETLRWAPRDLY